VQKLKSWGFTIGVKPGRKKIFSICLKLLTNAELYGLVFGPEAKKGYQQIWEANLQPLGLMLPSFTNILASMF
jgi:hypothetical protein